MNAITRSVGALDTPVDAAFTAHEGRDAYLAENGFSLAAYDDAWVQLSFFSLRFTVPNPPSRRRAVRLHDLHHVATGYGTDLVGEAEVSAWELRGGLKGLGLYPSLLVLTALGIGLVLSPKRTWTAWQRAAGARSLFNEQLSYEELLAMRVGALRERLHVVTAGQATHRRGLHPLAPKN